MRPEPRQLAGPAVATRPAGLHRIVADIAAERPDAVAVRQGPRAVSYAELDRTADGWAAALLAAGAAPGDLVPILLPRGVELVTALLAVLKTGAAYALLDPAWPTARLREVSRQMVASLLVARDPAAAGQLGLRAWTPPTEPVEAPSWFRPAEVGGDAPCCVFFTSGTTGRPKGVLSPHQATARLFPPDGFARFGAGTVMPLAAPAPWDAFSLELWSVLLTGGCSLIIDEPYLTAASLRAAVAEHGASTVWLTASVFNMIVEEDPGCFAGLDQVLIGGERLSPAHVRRFLLRHPGVRLLNGYGPVESTVFATTHAIAMADCDDPDGIPLGRPVPGTQVRVLDGSRPCAPGEVGEICIAGEGLALCYLGDPELTIAKFAQLELDGVALRVYRTGDLGFLDADGLLRFRGRADRQVKIRGHRVEPAEVERRIEELLGVRSCRVVARRDENGAARDLLAFCVPATAGDPLDGALAALAEALPAYQRPALLAAVPAFPLTAQGKLDERALLAMAPAIHNAGGAAAHGGIGGLGHDDPSIRLIAEVLCDVLGLPDVSPDASFAKLGGTSLAAGRVCARLSGRLNRPIPLNQFYERSTARQLAGWLSEPSSAPQPEAADAPPADGGCPDVIPLTPMQLVYLARQLSDPDDRTAHCLLTWVLEGDLDQATLQAAIDAVHQRHEPLRTAYLADPRPAAEPVDIDPPALEILSATPSVEAALSSVRALLAQDLDPTAADVWRTALVPVEDDTVAVLGCAVHHIAFDGWSEAVLAADLASFYNGAQPADTPPTLAEVHRHATRCRPADEGRLRDRLRAELAGVPELSWPARIFGPEPRSDPEPRSPGLVEAELTAAMLADVNALAADAGVSSFAVLLWQWAVTLAEVADQNDFAVGVPIAQRDRPGLENAIGCHIAMLCLRMRGAALGAGTAAAREVARIFSRALAAQEVPFADLVRLAGTTRTGRPPLFQTLFALQDNAVPQLRLSGLRSRFIRQPYLDLPLELHGELWPADHGGLLLTVYYRPEAVADVTAREIAKRFADRLRKIDAGEERR